MPKKKSKPQSIKILPLAGFILLSQTAGIIGSIFTFSSINSWYSTLQKPFFSPPNAIFGPIWITLYTLMGFAAYLVWRKGFTKNKVRYALTWFSVQLFLNALWPIIFFGLQNPGLALPEILILYIAATKTTVEFGKINYTSGLLMYPYLAWLTLATLLNLSIILLN